MSVDNPGQNAPKEILPIGENIREDSRLDSSAALQSGVADRMQAPGSIKDAGFKTDSELLGDKKPISAMSQEEVSKAITATNKYMDGLKTQIVSVEQASQEIAKQMLKGKLEEAKTHPELA